MKIMMIDPWGVNNISHYTNGLCKGISEHVDMTLYTNFYYKKTTDAKYVVNPVFFKASQKMKHSTLRTVIRGIEYIVAYKKIIKKLRESQYDVVHIQWLLQYKVDIHFLRKIKKCCNKIVYTAHNVVPHRNGERYIEDLKVIYGLVDTIILHGEGIKKEFIDLFRDFESKIIIQRHGTYLKQNTEYDTSSIEQEIIEKVQKYKKIYIFFGNIFYNKGVDRLIRIWLENFKSQGQLLIIAGRTNGTYKELDDLEEDMNACDNILFINKYVDDNLLSYLINKSDIILLPYRHASMSGVIFTAAEYKKTVLCTDTGSIAEYIVDGENCFMVANQDEIFCAELKYISTEVSQDVLANMGNRLNYHITSNYSWDNIGKKLVEDVYRQ